MKKRLLLLTIAILCAALAAIAYTRSSQGGNLIAWPANASITVVTNSNLASNSPATSPDLVRGALLSAMNTWNVVMAANGIGVRYVDGGPTSMNTAQCDQVSLISFTATLDPPLPSSVLAVALTSSAPSAALIGGCGPNIQTSFAGQIIDADMVFNPSFKWSTIGLDTTDDIEPVALHEAGHMLGLNHSAINFAIMNPAGDAGGFALRRLTSDDIAGINAAYGANRPGGTIAGTVTNSSGGVLGAAVTATDATSGLTIAGTLSGSDGKYTIVGIPPGSYRVFVEPLDGPISKGSFSADLFQNSNTSFSTVVLSTPVSVAAGGTGTANFTVGAPVANAQTLTVLNVVGGAGTGIGGPPPISVRRGQQAQIGVGGTGLTGDITLSAPAGKVTTAGATGPTSGGLARLFNLAADAPTGAYDVYLPSAALSGALYITVNPVIPSGGIVEGASFNRTPGATVNFAPGSIISIFGTDLAEGTVFADRLPLANQLGAVSVRIGDRLAPLYYVSPGQINAMIPYEVSGTVAVKIEAGNNSTSASTNITLGSSAPRIFSVNSQGTGQGAILSAKNVLVDANNPATAGDVIVIYCEGLGPTTPAVVSGVASPANQIAGALRVTIGGVDAPVQYKGLSPGFVGLFQVNATVPAGVTGSAVNVQLINASGAASNTVTIGVK